MRKVRILTGQAFYFDNSEEDEMVGGETVPTMQMRQ